MISHLHDRLGSLMYFNAYGNGLLISSSIESPLAIVYKISWIKIALLNTFGIKSRSLIRISTNG